MLDLRIKSCSLTVVEKSMTVTLIFVLKQYNLIAGKAYETIKT